MPTGPDALDMDGDEDFDRLMDACQAGNEREVKISLGARVELVNGYNSVWWTPIMKAALGGQPGVMQLLIDAGADVDAANEKGTTALILAAYTSAEPQFVECIKLLLKAGADKSIKDTFGQTAMDYATEDEHAVAMQLLQ